MNDNRYNWVLWQMTVGKKVGQASRRRSANVAANETPLYMRDRRDACPTIYD